jgi:hypothetical protein
MLRTRHLWIASAVLVAFLQSAHAATSCKVVDLMPEFWRVLDASSHQSPEQQVRAFRAALVYQHPDLFGAGGLGFESAAQLDQAIPPSLARARANRNSIRAMHDLLEKRLPSYLLAFKQKFPDFRCDFPIYLVPSLYQLDGAGRMVDKQPSLILGIDLIAEVHSPASLGIFIHHELFHRYHYQVAGFSDDNAEREVLWRGLWAEGLATYVSMKLNPPASMQDALFLPNDLVKRSQPVLRGLISEILPNLDRVDPELFSKLFLFHGADANPPSRVGYYIGALAAQRIGEQHSLFALAHMQADSVRTELSRTLSQMMALREMGFTKAYRAAVPAASRSRLRNFSVSFLSEEVSCRNSMP